MPNYRLRDGTRQLARNNGDAYRARNNTPRDFSFGSHSSVVFSLAMRQWMGLRTSRAQFSLRFVHFCASFYEWVTRIRVNPQIQIAIDHFSSDIFDRSVIDQASSQVR